MSEQGGELQVMGIGSRADESVSIHGLTVPAWFTTVLYRPSVPYSATVFVRVDPERGPLPEGIQVNANPGSGLTYKDALDLLKGAPVDKLLHQALTFAAPLIKWQEGLDALGKPTGAALTAQEQETLGESVKEIRERAASVPMPVPRRSVTHKLLTEVATIYRNAVADSRPPTKAVAQHFSTTHSTAARWVREARSAGILGPSKGPTAGEDPPATASG